MKKRMKVVLYALLCGMLLLAGCGDAKKEEKVTIKVGSMKGPTSMGLMHLMNEAKEGNTDNTYEFKMVAGADELLPSMISGDLDIALVPANVAAILYQKTEGQVTAIDINTLGVLYMVSGDASVKQVQDLKGKTIYLTGKGTTPDYVLQYLLKENGVAKEDVALEYKSEPTEILALLGKDETAIGVLPQPFVTAACMKNESLSVVMDFNEQWDMLQGDSKSRLVTGVTVVRKTFLKEHKSAVESFLNDHKESALYANEHVEETAALVAEAGIIEKAPIAEKAIPNCNITYIDGIDMKNALYGYLNVLYTQDATAVGGKMPEDDFYFVK